jgi:SAM-dependent methyltransferase
MVPEPRPTAGDPQQSVAAVPPTGYFGLRNISPDSYGEYTLPAWLRAEIGEAGKNARILDFGCGFGQTLRALRTLGYAQVEGADIEPNALAYLKSRGDVVHDLRDGGRFFDSNRGQFDLIVTQHVLEHVPKVDVVDTAARLRGLLKPGGKLLVAVPNAQAFTGAYWAYEDFTHHTLYTSGSIYHVLRAGGFSTVEFLDVNCTTGLGFVARTVRRITWYLFRGYYRLMCKLLDSPTHRPSPDIFSYEIKVRAR